MTVLGRLQEVIAEFEQRKGYACTRLLVSAEVMADYQAALGPPQGFEPPGLVLWAYEGRPVVADAGLHGRAVLAE